MSRLCGHIRRDIRIYEDTRDPQVLDSLIFQMDLLLQHLHGLRARQDVVEDCAYALAWLSRLRDNGEMHSSGIQLGFMNSAGPGRPRYNISQEQLEHLLHLDFECPTIASMLGVSLRTIRRRMSEYNLTVRLHYSDIDDAGLIPGYFKSLLKPKFSASFLHVTPLLLRGNGRKPPFYICWTFLRSVKVNVHPQ